MPIRKELRRFYGHAWRTITRPQILERAGNCCEQCRKPNGAIVETIKGPELDRPGERYMFWRFPPLLFQPANSSGKASPWTSQNGQAQQFTVISLSRCVVVVLTIAHLNHVAGDDRPQNLRALCQWCHLMHDREHHRASRITRKDNARPLFAETFRQ